MDTPDHGAASTVEVILTPKQQLGGQNHSAKAPATLGECDVAPAQTLHAHESEDEVPTCGWSAVGMWAMFVLGFVLLPCWWVGVAVGLKSGGDKQCLMMRRKKLPRAQNAAWWGCVAMSVASTLLLILVLSIRFGNEAPAQEGECPRNSRPIFRNVYIQADRSCKAHVCFLHAGPCAGPCFGSAHYGSVLATLAR